MQIRTLKILWVAMAIVALALGTGGARADWSFAILGDTRGNDNGQDAGVSTNLNAIARKIASLTGPKPAFVLVNGDLISGELIGSSYADFMGQFNTWKTAMNPVVAANIPIYPVRGNHENEIADFIPTTAALKQAYYDSFGTNLPTNGPNNGPDDDQRGFSYSFTHSNLTVVAVDQYFYYDQYTNHSPQNIGYHSLDQQWVEQQLQAADTPYKLVMVHEPAFITTGQDLGEQFFGTEADGLQRRANFWNALGANGCRLYVCGHVHALSVASIADDEGREVYQLMTGNGGAAPEDMIHTNHEAGVDVLYTNGTHFGFALVTVRAKAMTIEYYLLNTANSTWSKAPYSTTIPAVTEVSSIPLRVGHGQAFRKIQAAVDAAKPGQVILVYPGTYVESVTVTNKSCQILARDQGVIVTPPGEGQPCFKVFANEVTIAGFEFTGETCGAPAIYFEGSHNTFSGNYLHDFNCPGVNGIECRDPDGDSNYNLIEFNVLNGPDLGIVVVSNTNTVLNVGNIIRNNTLYGIGQTGIVIANGTRCQISGNVIQSVSFGDAISIIAQGRLRQSRHTVTENTILGCAGYGIALYADDTAILSANTIRGNHIEAAGAAGIYLYQDPGATLQQNQILGNSVRACPTDGILLDQGAKLNRVVSNLILNSGRNGISVAGRLNQLTGNTVLESGTWDLADTGSGNHWRRNRYETSSWENK